MKVSSPLHTTTGVLLARGLLLAPIDKEEGEEEDEGEGDQKEGEEGEEGDQQVKQKKKSGKDEKDGKGKDGKDGKGKEGKGKGKEGKDGKSTKGKGKKAAGRSPSKKGKTGDRVEISKGGKSIDGQYVIVTVDEVFKPEHGLEFKSYDLDTSEYHEVKVSMETIKNLVDENLLKKENREELSNTLMARLKFEGSDLKFDDTPKENDGSEAAPADPAPTEKKSEPVETASPEPTAAPTPAPASSEPAPAPTSTSTPAPAPAPAAGFFPVCFVVFSFVSFPPSHQTKQNLVFFLSAFCLVHSNVPTHARTISIDADEDKTETGEESDDYGEASFDDSEEKEY